MMVEMSATERSRKVSIVYSSCKGGNDQLSSNQNPQVTFHDILIGLCLGSLCIAYEIISMGNLVV